jgi:hypothetical protein
LIFLWKFKSLQVEIMNIYFVKIIVEALIFYLFFLSTNLFMGPYSVFFFFFVNQEFRMGPYSFFAEALFNFFFFSHKLMLWGPSSTWGP